MFGGVFFGVVLVGGGGVVGDAGCLRLGWAGPQGSGAGGPGLWEWGWAHLPRSSAPLPSPLPGPFVTPAH